MKRILFLIGVLSLLTTVGCIVSEERRHGPHRGEGRYEGRSEIRVAPVVIVPEVHIHP